MKTAAPPKSPKKGATMRVALMSGVFLVFSCAAVALYSVGELTTDHRGHKHRMLGRVGRIHAIVETTETVSTHSATRRRRPPSRMTAVTT